MIKYFSLISLITISFTANSEKLDWLCFKSINQTKEIKLAFAFSNSKNADAFVFYQNGSKPIPLKTIKHESENLVEGRPDNNYYIFKEITGNKSAGTYTISYQGAIFDQFSYKSSTNKNYDFEQDTTHECHRAI